MCSTICKGLLVFAAGAAFGMIAMPYLTEMCDNSTCNCIANEVSKNVRKLKRNMNKKHC